MAPRHNVGSDEYQASYLHISLYFLKYVCLSAYMSAVCLHVCLSMLANYRLQVLLERLGRYVKLFVSTVIPSISVRPIKFSLAKNTQQLSRKPSLRTNVQLNEAAARRNGDNPNGDSVDILSKKRRTSNSSKGRQREFISSRPETFSLGIIM